MTWRDPAPGGALREPPGLASKILLVTRVPFTATASSAPYERIQPLPVSFLLDNVRSLYNVGAFFRTADSAALAKLYLAGITAHPPQRALAKTALGAEERVAWEHAWNPVPILTSLRGQGCQIAAIETSLGAVDLFDWVPAFPVCVVFGHEVDGVRQETLAACDLNVRIPMLGKKHSLNVATAGGVVAYELLRRYRRMLENRPG